MYSFEVFSIEGGTVSLVRAEEELLGLLADECVRHRAVGLLGDGQGEVMQLAAADAGANVTVTDDEHELAVQVEGGFIFLSLEQEVLRGSLGDCVQNVLLKALSGAAAEQRVTLTDAVNGVAVDLEALRVGQVGQINFPLHQRRNTLNVMPIALEHTNVKTTELSSSEGRLNTVDASLVHTIHFTFEVKEGVGLAANRVRESALDTRVNVGHQVSGGQLPFGHVRSIGVRAYLKMRMEIREVY